MDKSLNLEEISNDVLVALRKHGMNLNRYGVVLQLEQNDFDMIASAFPNRNHEELILETVTENDGRQWFVQIMRSRSFMDNTSDNIG